MLLSSFHLVTTEPFRTALGKREDATAAVGSRLRNSSCPGDCLSNIKGGRVDSAALETDLGWRRKCGITYADTVARE